MPTISPRQADALRMMEWMYSERREDRRSGRTFVLALAALRHAFDHPGRWVDVEDHHHDRNSDAMLLRQIHELARQCSITVDIDGQRRRFRVSDAGMDSRERLFESFTVGDPHLDTQPRLTFHSALERIREQRTPREEPPSPAPPAKTQWERLNGDDPV